MPVVSALLLALLLSAAALIIRPQWLLGVVNATLDVQVSSPTLQLDLMPVQVTFADLQANVGEQQVTIEGGEFSVVFAAWLQDRPFWTFHAKAVQISLAEKTPIKTDKVPSSPATEIPNEVFEFQNIAIESITVGQVAAQVSATRIEENLLISAAWSIDAVTSKADLSAQLKTGKSLRLSDVDLSIEVTTDGDVQQLSVQEGNLTFDPRTLDFAGSDVIGTLRSNEFAVPFEVQGELSLTDQVNINLQGKLALVAPIANTRTLYPWFF